LYISTNTGADQLILSNWFTGRDYQVEQLRFADGTVWDASALTAKAAGADIDPLGAAATTSTIQVGGSTMGSIAIAADHDWYKVALTAGVSYQFDQVKLMGENLDSYLRLRDVNGVQLAYNDDSGGNLNSLFSYTPTQTGTYYIDAGGYNETSVGKYILSVIHREVGTANADVIAGTLGADQFEGGAGDDVYTVNDLGDVVIEGLSAGLDQVNSSVSHALTANVENLTLTGTAAINGTGNALNNVLVGNAGNNVLTGGAGNDTYMFGRGAGQDLIIDTDATPGNTDVLSFGSGIASDQLWFQQVGNDLRVSIIGSNDSATIQSWYGGSQNQIEQIKVASKTLLNTDVEKLVQAMSSFAAPASGQITLPTNYQTTLAPVIAANWR
jgi:Ca2+-binding RTX toxin-like protein